MIKAALLRPDQRKEQCALIAALYVVLDRAFTALERGALPGL
jgi:hypothetical protein